MRALRQTFVLTPSTKVAVDRSVVQPATNFIYVIKSTNVCVLNMYHHVINPYIPEVEIFEFVHDIHMCYLENFKEQAFEEKKFLLYSIVELWGVPKMEL